MDFVLILCMYENKVECVNEDAMNIIEQVCTSG